MYPYAKTLKKQGGRCAICRRKPEPGEVFHYDHDHKTKRFRGLLCHQCNHGLGGFHDRVDLLEVAIVYLQDPNPIKHYLLTDTPRRRLRRTRRYANA
jgi:hypothetical protein